MPLPTLPADKANHALYGALIFATAGAAVAAAGHAPYARAAGAGAAFAVGCIKEAVDWWQNRRALAAGLLPPHAVEAADALATTAGAMLCWAAADITGG